MSYSGQSLKRFEDPNLITGRGSFVDDFKLPDMVHAYVLRSPHAHAHIRSIDASAARNLPGVVAVLTGEVKIIRYVALHDCGHIINPLLFEGQVHGAIAQGIGQALTEVIIYSPEGQLLTGSLMDYAPPTAEELSSLMLDTMETPSPMTPMGVKGVGELPTVAAPAAVANAVMDALSGVGIRHIDTPLTSEKVWRALQSPP